MLTSEIALDHTLSADGTRIGFERLGTGPGLVLVQGAMGTAYSFRELAQALADTFTVIVPDRRGRGHSPRPFSSEYTIEADVQDLDAVLQATGASCVFGLSAGGDIALTATLELTQIEKLALFEPAIFLDGMPRRGVDRLQAYFASGDLPGALATGMKLAEFGPAFMRALPDWVIKRAIDHVISQEAKAGSGGYAPMTELALAFQYDLVVVEAMDGTLERVDAITQPVLLLGAEKSPAYLRRALDVLERRISDVQRIQLPGADHAAAWNVDRQRNPKGDPATVAQHLTSFFAEG